MIRSIRNAPGFVWGLLALLALALAPWIWWLAKPEVPLHAIVVDKTVPFPDYREHKGFMWVLNQQKYTKPNGGAYAYDKDYYGLFPGPDARNGRGIETFETKEWRGEGPTPDLVYVTDTYGAPTYNVNGVGYGGLTAEDADALQSAAEAGAMLVMEFNSVQDPTGDEVRTRVESALGVRWTGWIGRYVTELAGGANEVPGWAKAAYEANRGEWTFEGAGVVLAHEDGRVVVLEEGVDLGEHGNRVRFTSEGEAWSGVDRPAYYNDYFDIVEAADGTEALAYHELDATSSGIAKLSAVGLDSRFPAVLRNVSETNVSYYFAGDFADFKVASGWDRYAGWERFKAFFTRSRKDDLESFYWRIYVPMMKAVLREAAEGRSGNDA